MTYTETVKELAENWDTLGFEARIREERVLGGERSILARDGGGTSGGTSFHLLSSLLHRKADDYIVKVKRQGENYASLPYLLLPSTFEDMKVRGAHVVLQSVFRFGDEVKKEKLNPDAQLNR